jgi:hypothetical protein
MGRCTNTEASEKEIDRQPFGAALHILVGIIGVRVRFFLPGWKEKEAGRAYLSYYRARRKQHNGTELWKIGFLIEDLSILARNYYKTAGKLFQNAWPLTGRDKDLAPKYFLYK